MVSQIPTFQPRLIVARLRLRRLTTFISTCPIESAGVLLELSRVRNTRAYTTDAAHPRSTHAFMEGSNLTGTEKR
jgi:hypothetical protein